MKRVALDKAQDHLDLASDAVSDMAAATNFKAYEQAWSQFLTQASRFYSKIEQGAKGCKVSEPWFGSKKHERRKDALLSYIHHARDCDEHTIDNTTAISADMLTGTYDKDDGFKVSFEFMVDGNGRQHFRNVKATGKDGEALPYELVNPRMVLLTVHDRRYGDKFDPPLMHRTRPIVDTTPRGVAQLALTYLREMLSEARSFPLRF